MPSCTVAHPRWVAMSRCAHSVERSICSSLLPTSRLSTVRPRRGGELSQATQLLLPVTYSMSCSLPAELPASCARIGSAPSSALPGRVRFAARLCADPRFLGAQIGALAVLHTWTRTLGASPYPHARPRVGLAGRHHDPHRPRHRKRFSSSPRLADLPCPVSGSPAALCRAMRFGSVGRSRWVRQAAVHGADKVLSTSDATYKTYIAAAITSISVGRYLPLPRQSNP
jgi:hypothetical protein